MGRAPSNEIIIADEACSRHHCELFDRDGSWLVRDLQSRNGTRIENELLQRETVITPGQRLRVGECELVFTHDLSELCPDEAGQETDEHPTAHLPPNPTIEPEPTILGK